jgi:uncharacterized metal-binding protein YceD (DUF177 family)
MRLSDLTTGRATPFSLLPNAPERKAIADALGIVAIKKLKFEGTLTPQGRSDWTLQAKLGATVVQDCVVTLDPVTTRIDEGISRQYVADFTVSDAAEVEMDEDDTTEELPSTIDLVAVMMEALSLALPAFPRAADATLGDVQYTEPGQEPMTDDDAKPFAGLRALRDALGKKAE